eukprot:5132413-Pyramimonas_sp.AAC.1
MTARLVDQIDLHRTRRNHASAVHLSIHTRVDKGARTYVLSPKNGPEWGHVVRRVTTNRGDTTVMQDTQARINISGIIIKRRYRMARHMFALDCAGNRRHRSSSDKRASDCAQGGLRSSMTIVSPPFD